ncbi:type III-B CRISPR module-associated Cmr3 family protein [Pokkaliibacter sp. MBI-7]|uniref:type III-B CRISPR module-associated Cmr3 family protein n=1 Tax=Pokkaliibacter sp. MBI-7 TaxID=3040600 RepID=UPI00244B51E0|nr:type III-B CRISPR module-associated Cmr3 family protein [Pokkaliibacter sp. MBI-7]MDH2431441.1 type III-B CRISPR module-associated Cmr3 family protein [Pokkaliibacter sp. MBI-7]
MSDDRFIQPVDVLYLRGNRLFDGAGDYSEAQMPPWPSMMSGALRARILEDDESFDSEQYRKSGHYTTNLKVEKAIGTLKTPGSFTLELFTLAKRDQSGKGYEVYLPAPADLFVYRDNNHQAITACYQHPTPPHSAIRTSATLPMLPRLQHALRQKPESGYWLTLAGLTAWASGKAVKKDELISSSALWKRDTRLGIALDGHSRTAAESQLYTSETVALAEDVGFIARVSGAGGVLPGNGLLRLGGDGRAASLETASFTLPETDLDGIANSKGFRVLTLSPCLFKEGWLPNGVTLQSGHTYRLDAGALQATLVCAAVDRPQVISGWNLAEKKPKAASRFVPAGSVYWFTLADDVPRAALDTLHDDLSERFAPLDGQRLAEGFNRIMLAPWAPTTSGK